MGQDRGPGETHANQSVDSDHKAKATHEERRVCSANTAEITRGKVSPDTDLLPFPQINSK